MANRANHYEAAFEAYVRALRLPCVAVDEAKRALSGEVGVKSPDFLLYPGKGPNLVVEVKGKRGKTAVGRRPWENWVTTDDLDGLARWQSMFGPGFRALLVFVYAETAPPFPLPPGDGSFAFRNRLYRFWAVELDEYLGHLRSRGPAWKAVAMARSEFRKRVRPLDEWLPAHPGPRPSAAPPPPETPEGERPMRMIRRLFAATCLLVALAAPSAVLAQAEAPAPVAGGDESEGSPIYGYLAFGALAGLALMIVCKSSRRS